MKLIKRVFLFLTVCFSMSASAGVCAGGKILVVTTTATLGSLVREIAGETVEVYAIASPRRDIHFYEPTPRDVLKVKKADVLVHGGLDLEAWRAPLLAAAGNLKFLGEGKGAIDASKNISLIEVPDSLSRLQGDIHAYGNPHYAVDPLNVQIMVRTIAEGLASLNPQHAELYRRNADLFTRRLDEKMKDWAALVAPYRGTAVVTYHRNWPYFARRFGLEVADQIEPKPGIPPTAKHVASLLTEIRDRNVKAIIAEPFRENETARRLSKQSGIPVVPLIQEVDAVKEAADYPAMIDYNLRLLVAALKGAEVRK